MQVEASFSELGNQPVELRMSRSSPGRYSIHDFAKNVYDVHAFSVKGQELPMTRPDPDGWTVADHGGTVTIKYKVFGDRIDGTYLGIDTTHAHINMPAAIMWARGLDDRPATLTFTQPPGSGAVRWQVATQLHPGSTPTEFTAPNLQYLMDSPTEFGPLSVRQFSMEGRTFRVAMHHMGTDAELEALVTDVQKVVKESGAIFGEYPEYEPGHFTFLADALPYASGDAMEHRNSTVITSAASLGADRDGWLDSIAHEFFHGWNVERIRPDSLEPFDFERANISGELWLGEGFTQYFGPLILSRAGLLDFRDTVRTMAGLVTSVASNPARLIRSAEEMSQMAPFTDGSRSTDRTNFSSTVISYYQFGGAIALALDLTLRERSAGRITLDDYMRALWRVHGKPGGRREGYVDRPYTMADVETRLAEVSGDPAFARDFFGRYIRGREVADYTRLLAQAGIVLRNTAAGTASWGDVRLEGRSGTVRVSVAPQIGTPAYAAGLDVGDELRELDGVRLSSPEDVSAVLRRHRPGDRIPVIFVDRGGMTRTSTINLVEEQRLVLEPVEAGGVLTPAQRTFRERWLGPR
jgi:predicted metalloprotease with PDZ domain